MQRAFTSLFCSTLPLAIFGCLIPLTAKAQITADDTTSTTVNQIGNDFTIEQGDRVDDNLFHSFDEFSVPTLGSAAFNNAGDIANIFSRVTGSNISDIDGVISANGAANLFLINPNGIIFGQNASLNLGGSFFASTADSFLFEGNTEFSASNPTAPPLLTVNIPIGLNFRDNPGDIVNQSVSDNLGLRVDAGETISFSGGEVSFDGGKATAPRGKVEVLGDLVSLTNNASIDVSSETGGGTVLIGGEYQGRETLINASRTYIDDTVTINADALTKGNGGRVIVWADEVTGFYGNISARGGSVSGHGGFVEVSGQEHLIFRGNVDTSAVNGLPGILLLDPTNIIIADGSGDEAGDENDSFAGNNSGVVGSILTTPLSEIDDTAPTTIYESDLEGLSGDTNIILRATNDIRLQDLSDDRLDLAAGAGRIDLIADADRDGVGDFVMEDNVADTIFTNGRNIAISGATLTIGNIDTSVPLVGDAGELIETALLVSDSPGGTLESISGNISNGEDVDLFQIYLTGEGTFSASTVNPETTLGTQLFLFDADGLGVYANLDQAGCNCIQSTLPAGNVLTPTEPGVYYLGISVIGNNAESSGGEIFPIGSIVDYEAIRAPTGDGGLLPLSGWTAQSQDQGSYRINLTGVEAAEATVVELVRGGDSGSITLDATGDININGRVDTSGNLGDVADSGAVNITARSLLLTNGARILSRIKKGGKGNVGAIAITATDAITLEGGGIFSTLGQGAQGRAGNITIDTGSLSLKDGASVTASVNGGNLGEGDGGAITITATDAITLEGGRISSVVGLAAKGNSGNITINTGFLSLKDGASVSADNSGGGEKNSGVIHIIATDAITLEDGSIGSGVGGTAKGNSGGITIDTGSLSITDGGSVRASAFGVGGADPGAIDITAAESVTLSGASTGIFSLVPTIGTGNSEGITINTNSLSITDGASVSAMTFGEGDAGDVTINAKKNITIDDGGTIEAGNFDSLRVFAPGTGQPGNINIKANSLSLSNQASIEAATQSEIGEAANINLTIAEDIFLKNNSLISATALGKANGGNVTINADDGSIVAFPNQDNDIIANAEQGNGGNIDITTQAIFGLEERPSTPPNQTNDIDASSEFGLQGSFSRNTPEVDPTSGLIELPEAVGDASDQISQNPCEQGVGSEFTIIGKGGIPPNPNETLNSNAVKVGLVEPVPSKQKDGGEEINLGENGIRPENPTAEVVPAQGWIFNEKGEVMLTAYQTTDITTQRDRSTPNSCSALKQK